MAWYSHLFKNFLLFAVIHILKDFRIIKSKTYFIILINWASLIAQLVKNSPAMQETPVQFLGREDPLEKG